MVCKQMPSISFKFLCRHTVLVKKITDLQREIN